MRHLARALVLLLVLAGAVDAHPGRLDQDNCHQVRHDYREKSSGEVLRAGERHCHRRLDQGLRADGSERLRDDGEAQQPDPDELPVHEAP